MSQKIHIAIEVANIADSIQYYQKFFQCSPSSIVGEKYALFRTDILNFSIKQGNTPGMLRHLGFEDDTAQEFSAALDLNGITWERFNYEHQIEEIKEVYGASQNT